MTARHAADITEYRYGLHSDAEVVLHYVVKGTKMHLGGAPTGADVWEIYSVRESTFHLTVPVEGDRGEHARDMASMLYEYLTSVLRARAHLETQVDNMRAFIRRVDRRTSEESHNAPA